MEERRSFRFGVRAPLEVADKLPTPEEVFEIPKITRLNLVTKILGPAMIALGASIGSGEWLMGPSISAGYGMGMFWLVWVGCFLQTVFNLSFSRVTMATGEPPIVYFCRAPPGPKLWAWLIPLIVWLQLAWPGWALGAGTGLGAIILGRIPGAEDAMLVRMLGIVLFFICLLIVSYGTRIARTLEIIMWVQVVAILAILIFIVAPFLITGEALAEAARGSVSFGYIPPGIDILLLSGWWAYIAYASGNNFILGNFYRDKGYGMGHLVGYISGMIGGRKVSVTPIGKIFKTTSENLSTWRRWYRILLYDQWLIFCIGGLIGMFLPSLIARGALPLGTKLPAWGIAAHVGEAYAAKVGPWGFTLIAIIGFVILFTTQIQISDALTRNVTDIVWSLSESVRNVCGGDIRKFYYPFFVAYILFACWAMFLTRPLILLLIGANAANLGGIFSVLLTIWANRQLPKEIRPGIWEYVVLLIFWVFCIFFFTGLILAHFFGIRIV